MGKSRNTANLVSENIISVDIINDRVGIGSTIPTSTLNVAGVVSATSFSGDGSNLTNTGSTLSAASGSQRVVLTGQTSGTMTASATSASLAFNASTGTLSATKFSGDGSALTGIAATENVRTNSLVVSGVSTLGNTVVGGGTTQLIVTGDARVTGILTIGTSSVTLDGTNNQVNVGTGVTIHHTNGVQVGGNTVHSTGLTVNQINVTGVITATNLAGVGIGTSIQVSSGSKIVGLSTGSIIYPGAVLQVIQTIKKDTWTAPGTTGTTFYGPVTGYAATITPTSTSSKILVICNMQIGTGYWEVQGRLVRNGSDITESWGDTRGSRTRCSFAANQYDGGAYGYGWYRVHYTYLDSPGVTTATTYSVTLNPYGGYYVYMNRTGNDYDTSDYYGQPASTMTLMEISQ